MDPRGSVLWDAGRDSVVFENVVHAVAADAKFEALNVPQVTVTVPPPTVEEVCPYQAEALHSCDYLFSILHFSPGLTYQYRHRRF
jgi:hypothetical protein